MHRKTRLHPLGLCLRTSEVATESALSLPLQLRARARVRTILGETLVPEEIRSRDRVAEISKADESLEPA